MVEHNGLDITCLGKYRPGSSSPNPPAKEKKMLVKLKKCLIKDYPQKNSEILSSQYGINLLLVGLSLMLALSHHGTSITEDHILFFMSTLMIIQLLWMLWYAIKRDRRRNSRPEKDEHAAASWLKAGLTVLALLSIILDIFRIGNYAGVKECTPVAQAVYPVVHLFHTISQVYFLWFHIQDIVKTFETFERFGVMHAVFTNLLLWCNGIMSESKHYLDAALGYLNYTVASHAPTCYCTNSICYVYNKSVYYLFPFNIEYHILVSATLFIMWKNIGRTLHYHEYRERTTSKLSGVIVGPILGLLALAGTISVLVLYIKKMKGTTEVREKGISMFYIYGVVMLVSMCVAGAVGLLVYRADRRPLETFKLTTRQLDTGLLYGSSLGAWFMSWCSVVAVLAAPTYQSYRWTNFVYSLLLVLEKYVQNLFIIESLYREVDIDESSEAESQPTPEIFTVSTALDTPYNGIVNRAYEGQEPGSVTQEAVQEENGQMFSSTQKHPEVPHPLAQASPQNRNYRQTKTIIRRQQILRNIAVFLLLCNISLWILPAFGCRPQYDNRLEQETFGTMTWITMLNVAMPLNLFYRMHSVASLMEVFLRV